MNLEDFIRDSLVQITRAVESARATWKPYAAARIAGEIILEERKRSDDAASKPGKDWHEKGSGKFLIGVWIGLAVAFIVIIIKISTSE